MTVEGRQPTSPVVRLQPRARPRWSPGPVAVGLLLLAAAALLCVGLEHLGHGLLGSGAPTYLDWLNHRTAVGPLAAWIVADVSQAPFFASTLGGVGLLVGALAGDRLDDRGLFPVACGSGLVRWTLTSAGLGLIAGNLLFGGAVDHTHAWEPTFVAFVSVPPALVVLYGPGWPVALTGAAFGALVVTPLALALAIHVCAPLGLPLVCGSVAAMAIGGALACTVSPHLPWMGSPRSRARPVATPASVSSPGWVIRRAVADFAEAPFLGSELAGAGMIAGTILEAVLDPSLPVYGSGLLGPMLLCQTIAAVSGAIIWRRAWGRYGWYPTFVPIVSVAPATVLALGGGVGPVLAGGLLGSAIGPPLAAALARWFPQHWHSMVANTAAMAISTGVIVEGVGLLPGFGR